MRIQEIAQEVEALGVSLAVRNEGVSTEDVQRLRYTLRRWHESLTAITGGRGSTGAADGVSLIAEERSRQVTEEGWAPEHDDAHELGEMARAAAAYALPPDVGIYRVWREDLWPWESHWWKPGDRVRELVKAGALIAAEIDRLQRERNDE